MTNRKAKKTYSPEKSACRALVVIDGTPVRKKAKREYEKALRELEKARQQVDEFHKEDKPGFSKWLSSHFGTLLTELRETNQKLAAKRQLLFEVESEAFFSNTSYERAYQRVLRRQEEAAQTERSPHDPADGSSRHSSEEDSARSDSGDFRDPLEEELNDFFSDLEDDFAEAFGFSRANKRGAKKPSAASGSRIKELYRALVRRLHPDTQSQMTAQKLEWWHQAQAAYEAGDAAQLEVILTLCEIGDKGTTTQTSVSLLQRITRQLKASLRSLKSQLMDCKRDLAWNFSKRTDLKAFAAQTQRALEQDLFVLRSQLESLELQFQEWAREGKRPSRKRRPPRGFAGQPEFLF